jgi:hypothetical protein
MNKINKSETDAVSNVMILYKKDHRIMIRKADHHRRVVLRLYREKTKYH